jgi:O-antigen ligase
MSQRRLELLFLWPILTVTWATVRLDTSLVSLTYSDLLISLFLAAFAWDRLRRRDTSLHRSAAAVTGFMLVFLAVYLCGYFDLQTKQAVSFWVKGIGAWLAHALFLICGVALLARGGRRLYVRTVRWFTAGIAICSAYGVVQLAAQAGAGINLDRIVVGTLTLGHGKTTGINVYGQVSGTSNIYRINALTGDPNHLGVILCVPLLMLLPYYLAHPRGRRRIGGLLLFLAAVQVLTLSRSAALGDLVGLVILLPWIRPILPRTRTIAAAFAGLAGLAAVAYSASHFVQTVVHSRTNFSGRGTLVHFQFYQLVPPALDPNPLFGMGFNTFAVFYQYVTGKADFSPHSFWIATLVETGMVGLVVYLAWFAYLTLCAVAVGRSTDEDAARFGSGLLAALAATAAANFFYLTMQFSYFFVVAMLVVSGALLFAPARVAERRVARGAAGTLEA